MVSLKSRHTHSSKASTGATSETSPLPSSLKYPSTHQFKGETDTSHFDHFDEEDPWLKSTPEKAHSATDRTRNLPFFGFTYKRNIDDQKFKKIQNLFTEIENTRDKRRQNRHNSENKNATEQVEKNNQSDLSSMKRQKTLDHHQDITNGNHVEEHPPEKKKAVYSSSLIKNKTPSYSSKEHKMIAQSIKLDDPKKKPLLISSTTKLTKPSITTIKKPVPEKDSTASLKMPIGLKRNNSPKAKPTTTAIDTPLASALVKNLPQPSKDKLAPKTPMSSQGAPKIGMTSSTTIDKKLQTTFKSTAITKNKLNLNLKDLTSKPKLIDTKTDLASKISSKNYHS